MKDELTVLNSPKSLVSESFRTLRSNLQFITSNKKSILITSSISGEGKSYVSSNLATAFALNGKKTILIDCDMRRGRQHEIFSLISDIGLSNLLVDSEEKFDKYIQKTNIENLDVITRGIIPPNPSELLDSEILQNLINALEKKYDIILLDGTPINGLSDSLILSGVANHAIIVTSLGFTTKKLLASTINSLETINCKIAGIVANKTKTKGNYNKSYYNYYTM